MTQAQTMTAADHANTIREATLHIVEGEGVLIPGADTRHADDCPGCKVIAALDALQAQADRWKREFESAREFAVEQGHRAEAAEAEVIRLRGLADTQEKWAIEPLMAENTRLADALRQISTTPRRPSAVAIARAALAEEDSP